MPPLQSRIEITRVKSGDGEHIRVRIVEGPDLTQVDMPLGDFARCVTGASVPCKVKHPMEATVPTTPKRTTAEHYAQWCMQMAREVADTSEADDFREIARRLLES